MILRLHRNGLAPPPLLYEMTQVIHRAVMAAHGHKDAQPPRHHPGTGAGAGRLRALPGPAPPAATGTTVLKPNQRPPGVMAGMLNTKRSAHTPW